ncbi:crm, partial [Drosophila busckii]
GKGAAHHKLVAVAVTEPEELLGSVTTQNCPGTRASARVIQKMKLDLTRPMTPPPAERDASKKEEKAAQKTPSQLRATNKTSWTNLERNCFFDALNEFGKDFEAMANCINGKLKRRNTSSDHSFKTKEQVRQHYYQTYHKIGKYVRYSDELKKPAQELYTLINYGEMRRKLQFLTEKHFMKLKQLIYQGQITVRCKGKNTRIKTPSCKALRRLNQLDDSLEDIRLPSKVEVLVSPANMEAFGRVQSLAQNPRGRVIVPLHKKLISFINTFQYKWRSAEARLAEQLQSISEQALCFTPKPGVTIHRPLLSITAYLSSVNICLTAYEERLGVKVRSETLMNTVATVSKRPRTESGSEKRSPESKKLKPLNSPAHEKSLDELQVKLENSSGDELSEEINELLSTPTTSATVQTTGEAQSTVPPATPTASDMPSSSSAPTPTPTPVAAAPIAPPSRSKRNEAKAHAAAAAARNFRPLLSDEVIKRMRRGWTVLNAADITIGDLYVVLGQDSKLELDYYWCDAELKSTTVANASATTTTTTTTSTSSAAALPYNVNDCDNVERVKAITTSTVSNKLKHLLLVANLSERVRKRQCSCGHSCDRKRDLLSKTQWLSSLASGTPMAAAAAADGSDASVFRTPMLPMRRPMTSIIDPVRQLSTLTRQKLSRHILVQRRLLPPATDSSQPYDLLGRSLFEPIERVSSSSNIGGNNIVATPLSSSNINSGSQISSSSSNALPLPEIEYDNGDNYASGLDMPDLNFTEENKAPPTAANAASVAATATSNLPDQAEDESNTQTFFNGSVGSVSPMHLLRDSTSNARWLEENINDFSLTSLLGHLDDFDATRDILDPSSSLSVISETSVDFRHKFQEISALLQQQEKD